MPFGWKFGDDQFIRYKAVGIKINKKVALKVSGAVCR